MDAPPPLPDSTAPGPLPAPESASLAGQHPADVAEVLEAMSPERAAEVIESLSVADGAGALEQLDDKDAELVIEELDPQTASVRLSYMAVDDAVDILAALPPERREDILARMPLEERELFRAMLVYPPESAGGIMSPEVTALPRGMTCGQAIESIRRFAGEAEQVYYTYVVDERGRLEGVLSLRDLILAKESQTLAEIMIRNIVSVPATMDREEVAKLLTKYGYFALPVVDAQGRLLGIVTVDDVVEVIRDEATEDMQRMVGAGADERIDSPVGFTLQRRVPWLVVNYGTALLAAGVIALFEDSLAKITALAVMMPIVAGQAGNTGAQSMAVVIRSIAVGETRGISLIGLVLREVWIGAAAGAAVGLVGVLSCWFWWRDGMLALVLGVALIASMVIATVSGALIPYAMRRLGFDPAQCSSIILTTITDISGFGLFLLLGTTILSQRA